MFSIKNLKIITESALTLSLCAVLNCITIFKMPYGGSVTLGHTAPLILFAFKNGAKSGAFAGLIYGFFQMLISFHVPPSKNFTTFVFTILLDYLIPYVLVGLVPFCKRLIKSRKKSIVVGAIFLNVVRFSSSVISGVLIWNEYVIQGLGIWIYSLLYNASYMIPETVITAMICYSFMNFYCPRDCHDNPFTPLDLI